MFHIKSKALKESAPGILNQILAIVKKYCGSDVIELETIQFLCKHDWRKNKPVFQQFINSSKLSLNAEEYYRHHCDSTLANAKNLLNSQVAQHAQIPTIKTFTQQLQFLIPKMSNHLPEMKK